MFDPLDEESAYIPDNDECTYGYDLSGLLGVKEFELSHTPSVTSILGWKFGGDWAIAVPSGEFQKVRIECALVISNNVFDMDHARRGVYIRLGKCGENSERALVMCLAPYKEESNTLTVLTSYRSKCGHASRKKDRPTAEA